MKKNSFVEGTIMASLALLIIKVLGAIYVIPFYSIIGESGGALYSYAYSIYSLLLNICTAGIPIAMSKIISEYNTLGMYEAKERALKIGYKIVGIISVILFFAIFVFAEEVSAIFIGGLEGGNTPKDIALVIRAISFCLLIIPYLAVKKGYLQGHKYITVSTNSQVLEQIVRIAVILFGSYLAINVFSLKVSIGVGVALLGAFLGGVAAWWYISRKIKKNIKEFNIPKDGEKDKVTNKEILKKIVTFSVPLIVIALAADIYSILDLSLVIRGLTYIGYETALAETISSVLSTWALKICMIVNAIATGLSISLIPHMVSSYVKKDQEGINRKFNQAVSVILTIGIPMSIGLSVLAREVYTLFYGVSAYGTLSMRILPYAILMSNVLMVISMALQGINKYKVVYISTIAGLLTDAILDVPLIILFDKIGITPFYGATVGTLIGHSLSIYICLRYLKKDLKLNYKGLLKTIQKMIIPSLGMTIVILIIQYFIPTYDSRLLQIPIVLGYALVGGVVYFTLSVKNNLLYESFGKEYVEKVFNKIKKILHIKK